MERLIELNIGGSFDDMSPSMNWFVRPDPVIGNVDTSASLSIHFPFEREIIGSSD